MYNNIDEEIERLKKISKYIKIDFKLYEKDVKKNIKKNKKQVIYKGVKYTTQDEFIKDYQSGFIDNISMERYDKIIDKLEPVKDAKNEELEKIKKFLLYYVSSDCINDLFDWWCKNYEK